MTLYDLLEEISEDDYHLPICINTRWEGYEDLQAVGVEVTDGEYIDNKNRKQTGRHILIYC